MAALPLPSPTITPSVCINLYKMNKICKNHKIISVQSIGRQQQLLFIAAGVDLWPFSLTVVPH